MLHDGWLVVGGLNMFLIIVLRHYKVLVLRLISIIFGNIKPRYQATILLHCR